MTNNFESCFSYKLIYVFEINDEAHKGLIKIGEAMIKILMQMLNLRNAA